MSATSRRRRSRALLGAQASKGGQPTEVRSEERAIEVVEAARDRLRDAGRRAMGVTGREDVPSFRKSIARTGTGWYPLLALGLLVMVDEFQAYGLSVLGPEIAGGLGISRSALAAAILLKTLAMSLAVVPMAAYVQHVPRRAALSVATAIGWSIFTIATGFVVSIWGLVIVMVAVGALTASVRVVHQPLLVDAYPPEARMRSLSFYRAANGMGGIFGPLLVGLCTAIIGVTWRGVFVAIGLASALAALGSIRLRDPGFGKWDTERVREEVRRDAGVKAELGEEEVKLGFFEISRRLMLIPTIRRVLVAFAILGMLLVPYTTYLAFFLVERWGMGAGSRALFSAAMPVFAIVALAWFGRRGEELFRRDPARLVTLAGTMLGISVTALAVAIFSPIFPLMIVLFGVATAVIAVLFPALNMVMFSIIPSYMRPHMAALSGIALAAVGGGGGLLLLGGVDRRFGAGGAIVSLALPGLIAGLIVRTAARTVNEDFDRLIDEIVEEEEIKGLAASGTRLPLLACRHIDFSYGQLQVLFDVNFTVDDGEMVALLGTNGAGKSTLLRVAAGFGIPSSGSVRLSGRDITYVDAERRMALGISQVPGGRAVFGPMTVVENLRAFGYSVRRNRGAVERGIEESFDAFPRLAERRNQLASTLSGGEQQMLGLARAVILRPRLLLIDELSLGLAPKIVSELLEMVRRINAVGTAIVLVEQSVNIALLLVQHAYFMEKGEIRFDGAARELLARTDLLRSVFLEGATKGLTTSIEPRR